MADDANDIPYSHSTRSWRRSRWWHWHPQKWWIFAVGILGALTFTFLALGGPERAVPTLQATPKQIHDVTLESCSSIAKPAFAPRRVYLHAGGLRGEGIGSVLHHFKQSIVFSRLLDAEFVLASNVDSDNRYFTSKIYNGPILDPQKYAFDARNSCRIRDFIPDSERDRFTRGVCDHQPWALDRARKLQHSMSRCTSVVDFNEAEITQDLNGCIMDWVKDRFHPASKFPYDPLPPFHPPKRPIRVGIHIRWGDTAKQEDLTPSALLEHKFYGSFSLRKMLSTLRDIRKLAGKSGIKLTVAMENADKRVLDLLEEKDYVLLDSRAEDDLDDMRKLSENDILLLGESSWGVLVHLIAPPGLTLVDGGAAQKFSNTTGLGRDVIYMKDYTPEKLRAALFPVQKD
ncbi:unnamed protein product [Mycena citricolor]|uniref:Uncharacterized protein n=1 Tax=Mycena citricolor TaxID=2018698 RepID=A0AAD2GZY1_9AGAR|nr:unnamed protein product [Mycena citricolor]